MLQATHMEDLNVLKSFAGGFILLVVLYDVSVKSAFATH